MTNNYDKIANHYDQLSRLVFFKSQLNAQIDQLKHLKKDNLILIVGGGTGWILEEITKIYTEGLHIVYVEISEKMIALSKKKNIKGNQVDFIHTGIEDFQSADKFDVILTPFLFDNFIESRATLVFEKLNSLLKVEGLWFLVDFTVGDGNGRWWKSALLKLMYSFFKLIKIVEATALINMEPHFLVKGYQKIEEQFYYGNFIKAIVFRKT
ncbi:class I SAM-dependent methyltransferase [Pedobacter punctiformis]|uniref:Class I SAM-dependent methyltransferase n=1 Tax=Pedobacter punctiformis TaxID=3004097 RepID=A0ABT4LBJ4_9SPHI|nr:class I SAM-dependent methyltransferase [Pedobacter sp. HCMS5-2]MCZ4245289.1 class I SAM-dependent methyltransferase [Pedobacter sp. HCMS5-2]